MLCVNDKPIGFDIHIPIGSKLEGEFCSITTYKNDYCYFKRYPWAIFKFIYDKVIED